MSLLSCCHSLFLCIAVSAQVFTFSDFNLRSLCDFDYALALPPIVCTLTFGFHGDFILRMLLLTSVWVSLEHNLGEDVVYYS